MEDHSVTSGHSATQESSDQDSSEYTSQSPLVDLTPVTLPFPGQLPPSDLEGLPSSQVPSVTLTRHLPLSSVGDHQGLSSQSGLYSRTQHSSSLTEGSADPVSYSSKLPLQGENPSAFIIHPTTGQHAVNLKVPTVPIPRQLDVEYAKMKPDVSSVEDLTTQPSLPRPDWRASLSSDGPTTEQVSPNVSSGHVYGTNLDHLSGGQSSPLNPTGHEKHGQHLERQTAIIDEANKSLLKTPRGYSVMDVYPGQITERTIAEQIPSTVHSVPIDNVMESIGNFANRRLLTETGAQSKSFSSATGPSADWNFDLNLPYHIQAQLKDRLQEGVNISHQDEPQLVGNVMYSVIRKGMETPTATGLIREIETPKATPLIQEEWESVDRNPDSNPWGAGAGIAANTGNVLNVQYLDDGIPTVVEKLNRTTEIGENIPRFGESIPSRSQEDFQREMDRLGLSVHVSKVSPAIAESEPPLHFPGEGRQLPDSSGVVGTIPASLSRIHQLTSGTSQNTVPFTMMETNATTSRDSGFTALKQSTRMELEKNISAMHNYVQRERSRMEQDRQATLIAESLIGRPIQENMRSLLPPNIRGFGKQKEILLQNTSELPEDVDTNAVSQQIIVRTSSEGSTFDRSPISIVILTDPSNQKATVEEPIGSTPQTSGKQTRFLPLQNVIKVAASKEDTDFTNDAKEPAMSSISKGSPSASETAQQEVEDPDKSTANKDEGEVVVQRNDGPAMVPLSMLTEQEQTSLSTCGMIMPKKINRYLKEKLKKQMNAEVKGDSSSKIAPKPQSDQVHVDVTEAGTPTPVTLHRNRHTEKPFICDECGRGFSHIGDYNSHVKSHTAGMPFVCKECGVGFRKSGHLINHTRRHTGEKPFVCKQCDCSFGQLGTLRRHVRIHTGEKPYMCSLCKKQFSQLSYMKVHMRAHTGDRPFKCEDCKHEFLQSGDLKKHMLRMHNDKKSLPCPHCSKKFGDGVDFKRHVRTHDGKLSCKSCDKTFEKVESLKIHKELFHSKGKPKELPHVCLVCDIGFRLKGDLQSHVETCHPQVHKKATRGKGKSRGKKRARKRKRYVYTSDEDDSDFNFEKDVEVFTVTVKKEADDESKDAENKDGKKSKDSKAEKGGETKIKDDPEAEENVEETTKRGTVRRKASRFSLKKLLAGSDYRPTKAKKAKQK